MSEDIETQQPAPAGDSPVDAPSAQSASSPQGASSTEGAPPALGASAAQAASSIQERAATIANDRPEVAVGAAFAGGLLLALILKRIAR